MYHSFFPVIDSIKRQPDHLVCVSNFRFAVRKSRWAGKLIGRKTPVLYSYLGYFGRYPGNSHLRNPELETDQMFGHGPVVHFCRTSPPSRHVNKAPEATAGNQLKPIFPCQKSRGMCSHMPYKCNHRRPLTISPCKAEFVAPDLFALSAERRSRCTMELSEPTTRD